MQEPQVCSKFFVGALRILPSVFKATLGPREELYGIPLYLPAQPVLLYKLATTSSSILPIRNVQKQEPCNRDSTCVTTSTSTTAVNAAQTLRHTFIVHAAAILTGEMKRGTTVAAESVATPS